MSRSQERKRSPRRRLVLELQELEERCVLSLLGLDFASGTVPLSSLLAGVGLLRAEATLDGQQVPAWILGEQADEPGATEPIRLNTGREIVLGGYIGDRPEGDPAGDVDVFRLDLRGRGTQVLELAALGPSIGSTLDPSIAVFGTDGDLIWQASWTAAQLTPLGGDTREVFATLALQPGTYFIAVSASGNEAGSSFTLGNHEGGSGGNSTGAYAVVLRTKSAGTAPSVLSTSLDGQSLSQPPGTITVQLSEHVRIYDLAVVPAYVLTADGERIELKPVLYDADQRQVTYLVPQRLANGQHTLVIPAAAIVDHAGQRAGADYVASFAVQASTTWGESVGTDVELQQLGPLFADELLSGNMIVTGTASAGDQDAFTFELLESGNYNLSWSAPVGVSMQLVDTSTGTILASVSANESNMGNLTLAAGVYQVIVVSSGGDGTYEWSIQATRLVEAQLQLDVQVPQVSLKISSLPATSQPAFGADAAVVRMAAEEGQRLWDLLRHERADGETIKHQPRAGGRQLESHAAPASAYTPPVLAIDPFGGPDRHVAPEIVSSTVVHGLQQSSTHAATGTHRQHSMSTLAAALYAVRYAGHAPYEEQPAVDWGELLREVWHTEKGTAQLDDAVEQLAAEAPPVEQARHDPDVPSETPDASEPQTLMLLTASAGATVGGTAAKSVTVRRLIAELLRRLADKLA